MEKVKPPPKGAGPPHGTGPPCGTEHRAGGGVKPTSKVKTSEGDAQDENKDNEEKQVKKTTPEAQTDERGKKKAWGNPAATKALLFAPPPVTSEYVDEREHAKEYQCARHVYQVAASDSCRDMTALEKRTLWLWRSGVIKLAAPPNFTNETHTLRQRMRLLLVQRNKLFSRLYIMLNPGQRLRQNGAKWHFCNAMLGLNDDETVTDQSALAFLKTVYSFRCKSDSPLVEFMFVRKEQRDKWAGQKLKLPGGEVVLHATDSFTSEGKGVSYDRVAMSLQHQIRITGGDYADPDVILAIAETIAAPYTVHSVRAEDPTGQGFYGNQVWVITLNSTVGPEDLAKIRELHVNYGGGSKFKFGVYQPRLARHPPCPCCLDDNHPRHKCPLLEQTSVNAEKREKVRAPRIRTIAVDAAPAFPIAPLPATEEEFHEMQEREFARLEPQIMKARTTEAAAATIAATAEIEAAKATLLKLETEKEARKAVGETAAAADTPTQSSEPNAEQPDQEAHVASDEKKPTKKKTKKIRGAEDGEERERAATDTEDNGRKKRNGQRAGGKTSATRASSAKKWTSKASEVSKAEGNQAEATQAIDKETPGAAGDAKRNVEGAAAEKVKQDAALARKRQEDAEAEKAKRASAAAAEKRKQEAEVAAIEAASAVAATAARQHRAAEAAVAEETGRAEAAASSAAQARRDAAAAEIVSEKAAAAVATSIKTKATATIAAKMAEGTANHRIVAAKAAVMKAQQARQADEATEEAEAAATDLERKHGTAKTAPAEEAAAQASSGDLADELEKTKTKTGYKLLSPDVSSLVRVVLTAEATAKGTSEGSGTIQDDQQESTDEEARGLPVSRFNVDLDEAARQQAEAKRTEAADEDMDGGEHAASAPEALMEVQRVGGDKTGKPQAAAQATADTNGDDPQSSKKKKRREARAAVKKAKRVAQKAAAEAKHAVAKYL